MGAAVHLIEGKWRGLGHHFGMMVDYVWGSVGLGVGEWRPVNCFTVLNKKIFL